MNTEYQKTPGCIKVRGGRVHNLKNIDVDIPLNRIVGIAGVSGSGKSSLALGILYAEGSRRYPVHIHPQAYDTGGKGSGGRGAVYTCGPRAASETRRSRYTQHIRNRNGAP